MSTYEEEPGVALARISQDNTERGAGVERQTKDVLARAKRDRVRLVEPVLVENDLSASRYATKERPGMARVFELAERGEVTRVIIYDLDRLTREPRDLQRLIDISDANPSGLVLLAGDPEDETDTMDLTTGEGRYRARQLVNNGAKYSDDISRRVRRAARARRAEGLPVWSFRPFGFVGCNAGDPGDPFSWHHPSEAPIVREVFARFVGGEPIRTIADRLNADGITQPARRDRKTGDTIAKPWTSSAVRKLLRAERYAGVYRCTVKGAEPVTAAWAPIVDADTFARAKRLLDTNADRMGSGNKVRHLLSGLAVCDACGLPLGAQARSSGAMVYKCRKDPVNGRYGCGMSVTAANLDAMVREHVLTWLDKPANRKRLERALTNPSDAQTAADLLATLASVEERRAEIATATNPKSGLGLTVDHFRDELRELAATHERATVALARNRASSPPVALALDPERVRAAWDRSGMVEERRALVREVLEPVRVRPAAKRGPVFDPERVTITYRY